LLVSPLLIGGSVLVLLPRDPITQANCDRIRQGMSEAEVAAILGREKDETWGWGQLHLWWKGARGTIRVDVAQVGNMPEPSYAVLSAWFTPSPPQTVLEKIRDWLGL
jgi:hypothetical protein